MALFLVQHGLSAPKDIDPEKGLSDFELKTIPVRLQLSKIYLRFTLFLQISIFSNA